MDRDSVNRLRFDRRLQRRRDWVAEGEEQAHLDSLPDVSDKMTRGLDEPDDADGDDASNETPSDAGGFSTPIPEPAATHSTPDSLGGSGSEFS